MHGKIASHPLDSLEPSSPGLGSQCWCDLMMGKQCDSVEHGGVDTVNTGPNLPHLSTHGHTIFLFNYADNNMDDALLLW